MAPISDERKLRVLMTAMLKIHAHTTIVMRYPSDDAFFLILSKIHDYSGRVLAHVGTE
jgi:hypothetical protein